MFGCNVNYKLGLGHAALHHAVAENKAFIVRLLFNGGELDFEDVDGRTPLVRAIETRFFESARTLIHAGA